MSEKFMDTLLTVVSQSQHAMIWFVFPGGLLHLVCPESRLNPLHIFFALQVPSLPTEVDIEDSGHGQFDVKDTHFLRLVGNTRKWYF